MSEQFDATKHFDVSLAEKYEKRIRLFCPSYDALHQIITHLLQNLPEQAHFLSVGAGTGTEIVILGKLFPAWHFLAVDVSSEMLNICRERIAQENMTSHVTFFNGKMEDYDGERTFDAASAVFVSHFIKGHAEKQAYFGSIASRLKTGGIFIFADLFGDPNCSEFKQMLEAWLASYAAHGVSAAELEKDRTHVENDIGYISEVDLFALLEAVGFSKPVRFYQTYLFGGWVVTKL